MDEPSRDRTLVAPVEVPGGGPGGYGSGTMEAAQLPLAFRGRSREREQLDRLLQRARGGESAVLVLRGEAGVGKTTLLRYTAGQAADFRLVHVTGVESEMELAYAALHQ